MKNNLNQLIIIGGGTSLKEGIEKGLWERLKYKFTIGCNYLYNFFEPTILSFVDSSFYNSNIETLKDVPLIIGQGKNLQKKLNNTIAIPCSSAYDRDLKNGIYRATLSGVYALSLGIYLLDSGSIFLLGYDYSGQGTDKLGKAITHFYQGKLKHRGCFDDRTEILTDKGWKNKQNISMNDKIYSLNLNTNNIEMAKIIKTYSFFDKGYWEIENKHKKFIFNKNHKLLCNFRKNQEFKLQNMNDITNVSGFRIPVSHQGLSKRKRKKYKNYKIESFLKFLGLWYGDGSIIKSRKITSFGLIKSDTKKYLETQLKELNIKYSKLKNKNRPNENTYQIYDKKLYSILKDLGNCYTKKIPKWIFKLDYNLINLFIEGFIEADGCIRKNRKETILISCNRNMLSQFQHLLFLCGKSSVLHKIYVKQRKIENRILKASIIYHLNIKTSSSLFFKNKNKKWINKIKHFWGVTINKNHTIFIRRNGQCMWTGNTGKVGWYNTKGRSEKDFGIYKDEKKIKIYNVSLDSKIEIFEKISYDKFFELLDNNQYDQKELREYAKQQLAEKYK